MVAKCDAFDTLNVQMSVASKTVHVPKWPFFLADVIMLLTAAWVVKQSVHPLPPIPLLFVFLGAVLGAGVCVLPFVLEHRANAQLAEVQNLAGVVEQINNLRGLTNQISFATAQWQVVQENAGKTVAASREIGEQMAAEAKAFSEFLQKANEAEKGHLRLEVDKLRRHEGEWLQVAVGLLDHVYALYLAGARSGQANIKQQLSAFQFACRDVVRRVGLVPFEAQADEEFNEKTHQLFDAKGKMTPGCRVAETVATGFSYQGQMIRPAIVTVKPAGIKPDDTAQAQLALSEPAGSPS